MTEHEPMNPTVAAGLRMLEEPTNPGTAAMVVRYRKPELRPSKSKGIVPLAKSDIMVSAVHVVRSGGETSFHVHTGMDGLWFVLKGRARFYTGEANSKGDKLISELGPFEGVFLPRGVPYWFEQTGDEELEILQVEAFAKGEKNRTVILGPPGGSRNMELIQQDGQRIEIE